MFGKPLFENKSFRKQRSIHWVASIAWVSSAIFCTSQIAFTILSTSASAEPSIQPAAPFKPSPVFPGAPSIIPGKTQQGIIDTGKNPNFKFTTTFLCSGTLFKPEGLKQVVADKLGQCTADAVNTAFLGYCATSGSAVTIAGCSSGMDWSCALSVLKMLRQN